MLLMNESKRQTRMKFLWGTKAAKDGIVKFGYLGFNYVYVF